VEGVARVTGERLPAEVSPPEEPEPGVPKEVVDPGASAMPVDTPPGARPTTEADIVQAKQGTVAPSEPTGPTAEAPTPAPAAAAAAATTERPPRPERPAGERPARPERATAPAELPEPPPGSVYGIFQDVLPGIPIKAGMGFRDVILSVRPHETMQVLTACKNHPRLAMDYLRCLTAVDQEASGIELVYQLYSFEHKHGVTIKTLLAPDSLAMPTVTTMWKAANWLERECWEMFGVEFVGHPKLEPLLLEEDTVDLHPLRKSHPYADIELKQGVGVSGDGGDEADGD
jgi:NADH-quinone oxidoreductase subunit C